MAGESTTFNETEQQMGLSSVLEMEHPTHADPEEADDEDDETIRRSSDSIAVDPVKVYKQAYPDVFTNIEAQADVALDVRRAGDIVTMVEVVTDESLVKKSIGSYVVAMVEKLPTGQIDMPGASDEEKAGAVVSVLLDQAREIAGSSSTAASTQETDQLRLRNKELLSIVTPDKVETHATIAELTAENAALKEELDRVMVSLNSERQKVADRDRLYAGQKIEGMRAPFVRAMSFGRGVVGLTRSA